MQDLEHIRREYLLSGLNREELHDDPFCQFDVWMKQAITAELHDPTAMTLATVDADGQPSQRIVLLKHFDEKGLVFYTNYQSAKAADIASQPKVCVHFPWHGIERQVKVLGHAEKVPVGESLAYFLSRPRESQVAAWASPQSREITGRDFLIDQCQAIRRKFTDGKLPLPDFWGGYRIVPHRFEFWQGRENRLHDRFIYVRHDATWTIEQLAP